MEEQILYVVNIRLQYCCLLLIQCALLVGLMLLVSKVSLLYAEKKCCACHHERNSKNAK